MKRYLALLLPLLVVASCSQPATREPVAPTIVEEEEAPARTDWTIDRVAYEQVLKDGLQPVMRWYFVKPHYAGARFVGYAVADIIREDLKEGPIRVGDVILSINDQPIERPEHALAVWRGLWSRKELKLDLLRKGKSTVYVIPIVAED